MLVNYEQYFDRIVSSLILKGVQERDARILTEELMYAESRGKRSHGLAMLEPSLKRYKNSINDVKIVKDSTTHALIQGTGQPGPIIARFAMDMAVEKAKDAGISIIGVINAAPFMAAGFGVWHAAAYDNMVSIAMSVAKAKVAPFGTRKAILGTNPIAIGFPAKPNPVVLDMAITKMAAADVRSAHSKGISLPEGIAYDKNGNMTTNPADAIDGALIPFGDYKGSGLGILIELLCGALMNVKCGLGNGDMRSMLFIVFRSDLFTDTNTVVQLASQLRKDVATASPGKVYVPGDKGEDLYNRALKDGLFIDDALYQKVEELLR